MAQQKETESIHYIRIMGTGIDDSYTLLYGLSKIKGINVMFANAMCHVLELDKNKKIKDLSEKEIAKIEDFLSNPETKKEKMPKWILNQRKDHETGKDVHIVGKDLEFNLLQLKRRLGKIKSYRGLRLRLGLPVRGQRTASNFRRNKTLASMKSKTGGKK